MEKRIYSIVIAIMAFVFVCVESSAQEQNFEKFIVGKWKVDVYGLPQGDAKMYINFEKKEGKLCGNISEAKDGSKETVFTKVELEDGAIVAYYTAEGYDVYFMLEKGEKDKVVGSLMDMFDMEGEKIKE